MSKQIGLSPVKELLQPTLSTLHICRFILDGLFSFHTFGFSNSEKIECVWAAISLVLVQHV